jgi:ketosteroid isomerase-like protein
MAQENVELLWRVVELWNARDLEPTLDLLDPEIELHTPFSSLTGEPYLGIAGYRQWRADVTEQFEEWHMNINEITAVGEDRVLAVGFAHVRGHESGIELDQPAAGLIDFRAGRLLRVQIFLTEAEARTAAGLAGS